MTGIFTFFMLSAISTTAWINDLFYLSLLNPLLSKTTSVTPGLYLYSFVSVLAFFVSKNIGEYDKILAPKYFFRIHKKYLINLKYIININNADGSNCELVGNLILPVAKCRKEDLVSFLNIR